MKYIKSICYIITALVVLYLLIPFLYLFSPTRLKDYVYRELCYHVIADGIHARSGSLDDFLKNIVSFVYTNIDSHGDAMPIIDDTSWDCFVRGFGYCDQQAWALSTVLAKKGIPSRLAMLKGRSPSSGHSLAEVYVDNKWRVVDPHMNAVYYNDKGELATFADMQNNVVDLAPVAKEKMELALYRSYFAPDYSPDRWAPLTKKQGPIRRLVFSPVYLILSSV